VPIVAVLTLGEFASPSQQPLHDPRLPSDLGQHPAGERGDVRQRDRAIAEPGNQRVVSSVRRR
jgi:hypothetical protein